MSTGQGTLIYSVTTGCPSGLTGLYRRQADSELEDREGGVCVPLTSSGAGQENLQVPQQLQCPARKMLVLSHLSKWDGVNKSRLWGFISSNSRILFQETKETSFWMISPKRVGSHCTITFSLRTDITSCWFGGLRVKVKDNYSSTDHSCKDIELQLMSPVGLQWLAIVFTPIELLMFCHNGLVRYTNIGISLIQHFMEQPFVGITSLYFSKYSFVHWALTISTAVLSKAA